MPKSLQLDASKCTSCLICEMACTLEHEGAYNPARARIKVFEFEHGRLSIPYTCTQCEEAWCMKACPTGAITNNLKLGAKIVNSASCVGCKVCTIACPYGTIQYHAPTGRVIKCNLCEGEAKCAKACPTGAIVYQ